MEVVPGKVLERIIDVTSNEASRPRYIIAYGGSSSGKTISILQWITLQALKYPKSVVTVGSESLPIIKKTVFIDWVRHVIGDSFGLLGDEFN